MFKNTYVSTFLNFILYRCLTLSINNQNMTIHSLRSQILNLSIDLNSILSSGGANI